MHVLLALKGKYIWIIIFIILPVSALNQNLRLMIGTGIALGETKFLKKNMFYTESMVGYEQKLKKNILLTFSVGTSSVSFDYYDTTGSAVYNERLYLNVPIGIKFHTNSFSDNKSSFYIGFGITPNWCWKDKSTIKNFQSLSVQKKNLLVLI